MHGYFVVAVNKEILRLLTRGNTALVGGYQLTARAFNG